MLKVCILGGYGTFGGRLAQLLAKHEELVIFIAGRSREKAEAFCTRLPEGARKVPIVLDRDRELLSRLAEIAPDILVDATGPFQLYGENSYRVVEACLALGIDYLDLADGSDFVAGIDRFDERARNRSIFILSGASTCPALTAAVVAELTRDFAEIDSVTGGIAPSPYAGLGSNVVKAIASYAGKAVDLTRNGAATHGYALTETRRHMIAPPGRLPLKSTLFSLVDVPDLRVLPELFPKLGSVWMGAGPVPAVLHRALIGLAWLVRLRLLPNLSPFAGVFRRAINTLRWGEHRGGMFVTVTGKARGRAITRSWHLTAEGDDGPFIPSMAAAAIVLRCLAGRRPKPGARSAAGEVDLADYETLFAGRLIETGIREETSGPKAAPLYRRILGGAWDDLPATIRSMHDVSAPMTARGFAEVDRGSGVLARLVAALVGFPSAGRNIPVEVKFEPAAGRETWRRTFAGQSFVSEQFEGSGQLAHLLCERFGPLTFAMAIELDRGKLRLVLRRWSFLGIPLPLAVAPRSAAHEREEAGRFHFHVEIAHLLTGLIVRYRGWLVPGE